MTYFVVNYIVGEVVATIDIKTGKIKTRRGYSVLYGDTNELKQKESDMPDIGFELEDEDADTDFKGWRHRRKK